MSVDGGAGRLARATCPHWQRIPRRAARIEGVRTCPRPAL